MPFIMNLLMQKLNSMGWRKTLEEVMHSVVSSNKSVVYMCSVVDLLNFNVCSPIQQIWC